MTSTNSSSPLALYNVVMVFNSIQNLHTKKKILALWVIYVQSKPEPLSLCLWTEWEDGNAASGIIKHLLRGRQKALNV